MSIKCGLRASVSALAAQDMAGPWAARAPGARSAALRGRPASGVAVLWALTLAAALAGCAGIVDKPKQRALYDFGPQAQAQAQAQATAASNERQPALVLGEVEARGGLEGAAVLYRLGYADAHELRAYAQARWSVPPAQLVRQRVREQLGRDRVILRQGEGSAATGEGGAAPSVLRLELEEFSQYFDSPGQSVALVRLRATLLENRSGAERLLAQRSFSARQPAGSADAPGGVRALAAATDAVTQDIARWLQQAGAAGS